MAANPSHIPLVKRLIICARIAYFDSFPEPELADTNLPLADLEEEFLAAASATWKNTARNGPAMDGHLDRLCRHVQQAQSQLAESEYAALVPEYAGYAQRFCERVRQIRCRSCAPEPGPVCSGHVRQDSAIVAGAGLCIAQIRNMLDVAVTAAEFYYRELAHCARLPGVHFSTDFGIAPISSVPSQTACGARTEVRTDSSEITLLLDPSQMDRREYANLLYLFFHEAVCHAYQGSRKDGQRASLGDDDCFAEGWMDEAAFQILAEVVDGRCQQCAVLRSKIPNYLRDWPQMQRLYTSRGLFGHAQYPNGACVARGRQTFHQLRDLAANLTSVDQAARSVLSLSLELNLLPLDWAERDWLVRKLKKHTTLATPACKQLLADYLQNGNAAAFREGVRALTP